MAVMLLATWPLTGCREATPTPPPAPWFAEGAAAVGIEFVHESGQRKRIYLPDGVTGGCCIFDYDGDGWMDVYMVQSGPYDAPEEPKRPSRLFRNRGNGTFEDVTEAARVGARGNGMACACGDYDGDGDPDLFVSNVGPDVLYRNEGKGTFTDVTAHAGVTGSGFGASAAFVDYDQDDDLDLFVTQYVNWSVATEINCLNPYGEPDYCKPDNYQAPAISILYRNRGDGTFEDVTRESGIAALAGNGLGIACADFDADGDMDAYVANDGNPNRLWLNDGHGRFTDHALLAGCAVSGEGVAEAGMGVSVVDVRNDGLFDLFVTNLVGETNTYYLNRGGATYDDRTAAIGLATPSRPYTAFGVGFRDFDHDGRLDLYVANGGVRRAAPTEANRGTDRYAQPDSLLRGIDGPRFEEVLPQGGTDPPIVKTGRGVAFGDLDNDLDVDVVVVNRDAPADVLLNVAGKRGNAVMFRVLNAKGADAIGALVKATAGGVTRSEWLMPSYSYCSSSDPRLHFGLGAATEVASVSVKWPGGKTETFGPFAAGKLHAIRQGQGR
jgi:hypothetical protein